MDTQSLIAVGKELGYQETRLRNGCRRKERDLKRKEPRGHESVMPQG